MTLSAVVLCTLTATEPNGVLTRAPQLEKAVDAAYPPEDLTAGHRAEVAMDVDIDETGSVTAVQVSSVTLDPPPTTPDPQTEARFAHAAQEAAAQFHFSPAEIDGRPTAVRITYRYRFTIRENPAARAEAPAAVTYETVVQGKRELLEVAKTSLSLEEIKRIPGTGGDAAAAAQMLPGVARVPYSMGQLPVRGTQPQDTRGYLDGILIPKVFHLDKLPVSAVNSDALSGIDFYPGSFSARFGRALGGTVEAHSRSGAMGGFHGYAEASLLDSKALVEGPTSENSSFLATVRRGYVGFTLSAVGIDSSGLRYYDYIVRHDWKLTGGRAAVYAYGSSDTRSTDAIAFHRLQGSYEKALSDRFTVRAVTALGYDDLQSTPDSATAKEGQFWSLQLRAEVGWTASSALELTAGVDANVNHVRYSLVQPAWVGRGQTANADWSYEEVRDSDSGNYAEPGAYLYATWSPLPRLRLVPGLRADLLSARVNAPPNRGRVDPRLSAFFELTPWLTLKAAAGLYSEPPPLRGGELSQRFGNPDLQFQLSRQYMLGASGWLGPSTTFDVQAYYKDLSQLVVPSDRTVERGGVRQLENYSNGGFGFSRGIEVLLRQKLSNGLFGWISYTLSESRQKPEERLPVTSFSFDQRHNLYAMLSQQIPAHWTVGASVRYTTGNWYTPYARSVYNTYSGFYWSVPGKLYSQRLADFLEIDLRIDKRWVFGRWRLAAYLDVRNVTNRHNVEETIYNYDRSQRADKAGLPFFPNIGIRGEF